jgi:serine/threonine protein kinase/cephalosporin-C deacetylase-like acetyl esterase
MGVVYKAEDTRLKRTVALKFLPPELTQHERARERFIREAQSAAALDHPNICTVHEIDEAEGKTFISMAYIQGSSLRKRIEKGSMDADEVLDLALQIAGGLEEAHSKGIIHRDIKSANIMVTEKGQAKIMDFGLAKVTGDPLMTQEGAAIGTVAYMSPEQARGEPVDHRSDLWSLGVVFYEMLTGHLPFQGKDEASFLYAIVHEEPKSPMDIFPEIPAEWQQIIDHALKKNPKSRYQSASEVLKDLRRYQKIVNAPKVGITDFKSFVQVVRKPQVAWPLILIAFLICLGSVWLLNRYAKMRWARNKSLPEIISLIEKESYLEAFELAEQAEKYIPDYPLLAEQWPKMSVEMSILSEPDGANMYFSNYTDVEGDWKFLGKTPIQSKRMPIGYFRWKIEEEGYEPVEFARQSRSGPMKFKLEKEGSIPGEMVRIPAGTISSLIILSVGLLRPIGLEGFWIDKYEVSNSQFKDFVDSGAYQKPEYWKHRFIREGKVLSWEEAMAEFKDKTGMQGPAAWELGSFPEGEGNYPVRGISWYEAAAYAEFAGKQLPTIYHWIRASGWNQASYFIPLSNYKGTNPAACGEYQGMSPYGSYDMAGNVREWCWNESSGQRYLLGGAWKEPTYFFHIPVTASTFDRSEMNGFRCVKSLTEETFPEQLIQPLPLANFRDYNQEKPVGDETFELFKQFYTYEKTDLNSVVEDIDEASEYWVKQKITFDAAYGNERVIAYLFLPKMAHPPYQTVVYYPGSGAITRTSSTKLPMRSFEFIMKTGRALLYPIYKSTYERRDGYVHPPMNMQSYQTHNIFWYKDLARSVDYLLTRPDIDGDKLAYYGYSWGAERGPVYLALENRFKLGILVVGGFILLPETKQVPQADQLNFAPRVKMPILMINGRFDYIFPYEITQIPMFRFLGTPDEHKDHIVYETDHNVPLSEVMKHSLIWLDKYLGPIK